ncbi:hypothetical protein [Haloarchaeobius salinus]|uniref:hypothetical protein n=1 Tax=Haloarchaeobius salinus TaxID=1198298 RepID=UPI002109B5D4|nr:hypothetical protein [Haloarchaeobius salinus]
MPATTGASHEIAAFASLIVGTIFSKFVWDFLPPLGEFSLFLIRETQSITGASIPVNEQFAGSIVVMVGLSFLWGVIYHFGRHS